MENSMLSIIVFVVLTLIYFVAKYYISSPSLLRINSIVYYSLILLSQFFINNHAIKELCGNNNFASSFYVTFIPWLVIFGLLNIALMMFPSWKIPFSNTFGYLITRLAGIRRLLLENILKPNTGKASQVNKNLAETLRLIYSDPSMIINEIPLDKEGFDKFWRETKAIRRSGSEAFIPELRKFLKLKDIVSEFIWYLLTGIYVTMISANSIINNGCNRSVEDMKKRHKQYEEEVANAEQEEKNKPKPKTYYIHD